MSGWSRAGALRWSAAAVLGVALAVALTLLTLHLTDQHVGLSGEPPGAGRGLVPAVSGTGRATTTSSTITRTVTVTVPTPTTAPTPAPVPTPTPTATTAQPPAPAATTPSGDDQDDGRRRGAGREHDD